MKVIEVNTAKEFASTFFGDPILKMAVNAAIDNAPTVDAVPVDKIIFHHLLIDKDGIPEVKLQLGERTLILRKTDPVDVVEVVRCKDCKFAKKPYTPQLQKMYMICTVAEEKYQFKDGFCSYGERKTDHES